jgi:hypothetical protein
VIRRLSLVVSRLIFHGCMGGKVRPRSGELGVESGLVLVCTALLRTANEHREHGEAAPDVKLMLGRGCLQSRELPGTWNLFLQALWHRHEDGCWRGVQGTRAEDI